MKQLRTLAFASLAALIAVGCGAADGGDTTQGSALGTPGSAEQSQAADGAPLARIELDDGNVVQFERLAGGVLVSELGSALNQPHLAHLQEQSALGIYQALAPHRAIPDALRAAHAAMYPANAELRAAPSQSAPADAEQALPADPDLQHDGEYQLTGGFLNSDTFLPQFCNFALGGTNNASYKHPNRTDAHDDISLRAHRVYEAIGADIGIITAQACVDVDKKPNNCNAKVTVNPGFANTFFYDPGNVCTTKAGITICVPKKFRMDFRYNKISSSVRFHDCAQVIQTN